ncbi:MAG: thioredoxin [Candidatus Staskawiczbacteria bacterium]|jgi:thioredoxin 1
MSTIITDENFDREIQSSGQFVLVDFFATWCGPCSVFAPILEKVAEDLKGKIVLIKAELDNIPITAQKFGIDRIPAVILFKDGKPVSGLVGLRTEDFIKEWVENIIKK